MLALLTLGCTQFDPNTEQHHQISSSFDEIAGLEALGYVASADVEETGPGVEHLDRARALAGTNLIVSAHGLEVLLTSLAGQLLHQWSLDPEAYGVQPERRFLRRAFLQPDGSLLAHIEYHSLWRIAANGEVMWHVQAQNHHHLEVREDQIYSLTSQISDPTWWPGEQVTEDFVTIYDLEGNKLAEVSILAAVAKTSD